MHHVGDTIAAIATPLGVGGVGIIRVSGPKASDILAELVGTVGADLRDRYLDYGHVMDGQQTLDEVLYVLMRAPRSFTGEDVAEIHGHGGDANLGVLLRRVLAAGARHAEPGEFSRRAFANGQLDLTRAEAIVDIVNASSEKALRLAQSQLQGSLREAVDARISEVMSLLAEIEAGIDFPEENLPAEERERQGALALHCSRKCRQLAESFGLGRALQKGIDVVLRGEVNAGKSSLFNALIEEERALVHEEAGTTRDYVEQSVVWDGIPVTLVDTAGIRSADSEVEDRGIAMGAARAVKADLELVICPAGQTAAEPGPRQLLVISKCDGLAQGEASASGIVTSARTGLGLDTLRREILRRCTSGAREAAEGLVVTSERQRTRLAVAASAMGAAAELIASSAPSELVVVDLNAARYALAEITGDEVGDEMLDELFSRFCIGK